MSDWGIWHDLIECPWCGFEDNDSWEYNGSDGHEINCLECEKPMKLTVDFEVKYATEKVGEKQQGSTQQNNQKVKG